MSLDAVARAALSNFAGCGALIHLTRLDRAGFSVCTVWRVTTEAGDFCLKCWPEGNPLPEQLPWAHQVLQRAVAEGLKFLPLPQQSREGYTFCEFADCTWELLTWLPGEANYHVQPNERKLQNAFQTLATFHRVTRRYGPHVTSRPLPAICDRLHYVRVLQDWKLDRIRAEVQRHQIPELDILADQWIATHSEPPADCQRRLLAVYDHPGPLQPAIRDLWHAHVLFTGDEVTGLIDFGAMRHDTPLVDISRLLGSFAGDDTENRRFALDCYSNERPLSEQDREVIELLDHVSTWIAGWNWLDWLYVEKRTFPSLSAVRERLLHLLSRTLEARR